MDVKSTKEENIALDANPFQNLICSTLLVVTVMVPSPVHLVKGKFEIF